MSVLKLSIKDNGSAIKARQGDMIIVSLQENPTTGYRWAVDNLDEKILGFTNAEFTLDQKAAIGRGGIRNFIFQALGAGKVNLTLKLRRQWMGDASTIERYRVSINVW